MLNPRQPTHQQCARVGVKEDATRLDSPITFCCLLHWRRRGGRVQELLPGRADEVDSCCDDEAEVRTCNLREDAIH